MTETTRFKKSAAPAAAMPPVAARRLAGAALHDPRLRTAIADVRSAVGRLLADDLERDDAMAIIMRAVQDHARQQYRNAVLLTTQDQEAIALAVYDDRYGLGPLQHYVSDPDVENIDVNGCDRVWVTYGTGERVGAPAIADSDDALIEMIRRWAARGGQTAREFSESSPLVTVALTAGARLTATMGVTPRPCLSIRRHGQLETTLDKLAELGTVDATVAAFLRAAVRARCNIIVTGGVNAGKTTMLRALAAEIPPGERLATLESEYELFLHEQKQRHPDVIAMESRLANSEGVGEVTLNDLIAHALRHNPQRIIVGEVRTSEIMPMLEAMNSGQEGSMCTLHANSPAEAFDRILILALRGGLALAERAIHLLVGTAVDLIVHVRKRHDGFRTLRYVSEILEVLPPGDTDRPSVNRLFVPDGLGGRPLARHTPSPRLLTRLDSAGFDSSSIDSIRAGSRARAHGGWR